MLNLSRRLEELAPQIRSSICIRRVPSQFTNHVNYKMFEPEMVSIGPYHRGQPKLKKMEDVKLHYFKKLLERKPEVEAQQYYSAVEGVCCEAARECYEEDEFVSSMSDEEFTTMLVLDGCFIIEVIRDPVPYQRMFPARLSLGLLKRDLIFLMENQIPWFVLGKLQDLIEGVGQHDKLKDELVDFSDDIFPRAKRYPRRREVKHILHLVHSDWCPTTRVDHTVTFPFPTGMVSISADEWASDHHVIPSASELLDANVKFSHTNKEDVSLFDVEFRWNGHLVIPTLVIHEDTESLFRNLIVYEQLFPHDELTPVSDFATLLDCLIDTPKDVQILTRQNIIKNVLLGSDNAVVDLVNGLTHGIVSPGESFMYGETFSVINTHYKRRWNRLVAALHRDYFSTPWAYLAFLAALMLLLLAIAQTALSAIQLSKSTFTSKDTTHWEDSNK